VYVLSTSISEVLYTIICYKIVADGGNEAMKIKLLSILVVVFMASNVFVVAGAVTKSSSETNLQSKQINQIYGNINGEMEPMTPAHTTGFIEWQKLFDSGYDDHGHCIQPTTDGGYIVVGNGYGYKVLLIKIDGNGDIQWEKNFGNSFPDYGWYVLQTDDGGYLVLAETLIGGQHVWLIKTDKDGTKEWERFLGYKPQSACRCMQHTRDGGYILAGFTSPANWLCCYDSWLLKIDSEGYEEWNRTFEQPYYNWAFYVTQTSDDGFIITGLKCQNLENYSDLWLIKTDSQGNMEWNKIFGDPKPAEIGKCVQQTSDGGYIVAGEIYEPAGNILIKTDDRGNVIWTNSYGGKCVQQTKDGGYIVTGCKTYKFPWWPYESTDLKLVKLDSQGKKKWCRIYGGLYDDVGNFVLQTEDGGYIIVGSKEFPMTYPAAQSDVWVIKTGEKPKLNLDKLMPIAIITNSQIAKLFTFQSYKQILVR